MRTLTEAIDSLALKGYVQHFGVMHGTLRDFQTDMVFSPDRAFIREYERFEGISDPDDMSIVYAIETANGTRGTLVDAFGAYSDPLIGALLEDMAIVPRHPVS
jgi:hypothetical protein